MDSELERFMDILRERGYKVTPQRLAVLRVLVGNKSHPSADQIYQEVRREHPMISLATVYKTLELLKELGEVMELGFSNKSTRYDSQVRPHLNLVCLQCGFIEDVYDTSLKSLTDVVENTSNFRVHSGRFEFYGLCNTCRSEPVAVAAGAP
ncbi:MAG: Fur family transcriptional regulator [Candidatus Geothermarchaeales archaeon]